MVPPQLRAAGAVAQTDEGYRLSEEGAHLLELYPPLQSWADRWADREGAATSRRRRKSSLAE